MVAGVVPLGVTDSHAPPKLVEAAAVKSVPVVPPTWIGCDAGAVPPIRKLKVSEDGLAVRVGPVTMSRTGITAGLPAAPGDVTVTVPFKVPGDVSPAVLIEM